MEQGGVCIKAHGHPLPFGELIFHSIHFPGHEKEEEILCTALDLKQKEHAQIKTTVQHLRALTVISQKITFLSLIQFCEKRKQTSLPPLVNS